MRPQISVLQQLAFTFYYANSLTRAGGDLPGKYNVERLKSNMHAGTNSAAKSKAAKFMVGKPVVGGFDKPFWLVPY